MRTQKKPGGRGDALSGFNFPTPANLISKADVAVSLKRTVAIRKFRSAPNLHGVQRIARHRTTARRYESATSLPCAMCDRGRLQ